MVFQKKFLVRLVVTTIVIGKTIQLITVLINQFLKYTLKTLLVVNCNILSFVEV